MIKKKLSLLSSMVYFIVFLIGHCIFITDGNARDLNLEKEFTKVRLSENASAQDKKAYLMKYLELLNDCMEEGDINAAFILSVNAVLTLPDERIIYANSGVLYAQMGKVDAAITCLSQALEKKDQVYSGEINSELIIENALGNCYIIKEKPQKALKHLLKAHSINENFVPTLFLLGRAYRQIKEYSKAVECYKKAFQVNEQAAYQQDYLDYADCLKELGSNEDYKNILEIYNKRFK